MAAIKPSGLDGGDEELGAVAVGVYSSAMCHRWRWIIGLSWDLRVGAGVGHGEEAGADVLLLEVLVGELLAVDGLAAGAVAAGEVTSLEHELGDDAVEG